jgi:hypothetical protein
MSGPPVMKSWLNWGEVSGKPGTVEELRALLCKYSPTSVLIACSQISVHLNYGPEGKTTPNKELTAKYIPFLFIPSLVPRVRKAHELDRVIFFQGQLRAIAAEITRLPPMPDESLPAIENHELGELMLRAAELLMAVHPKPTDPWDALANLAVQWIPFYELDSPTDPFTQLMRIYIMLTVNIPRLTAKGPLPFDVAAEFEKVFGFPLKLYINFMFLMMMHATIQRDELQLKYQVVNPLGPLWLASTTLTSETIHQVMATVSFDLAKMKLPGKPNGYADFTFLRANPYFSHESNYFCLDYDFGFNKLESGVLYGVLDNLPKELREPYLSFWGPIFEDYLAWLFETYASAKHNTYYPSPTYTNGNQICDAIVICGTTAVLIEAKIATCDIKTKYSGDYKLMKSYLETKLVGTPKKRKGVTQLLAAFDAIVKGPKDALPPYLAKMNKIIPLIVTKDEVGSSYIINTYLDKRLEEQINRKEYRPYTITPLVVMSVGTMERAMSSLAKMSLGAILEDRIGANRELSRPFEAASKYVHKGTARNMPEHMKLMSGAINEVMKEFGIKEDDGSPGRVSV